MSSHHGRFTSPLTSACWRHAGTFWGTNYLSSKTRAFVVSMSVRKPWLSWGGSRRQSAMATDCWSENTWNAHLDLRTCCIGRASSASGCARISSLRVLGRDGGSHSRCSCGGCLMWDLWRAFSGFVSRHSLKGSRVAPAKLSSPFYCRCSWALRLRLSDPGTHRGSFLFLCWT